MTNPLRLALEDVLRPASFSRKGDSWYRTTVDVIEVVNLQKSQNGEQHYLNFALWLRTLGAETFPKEEKCHVRMRGAAILSADAAAELASLLDFESAIPNADRRRRFARLIADEILPFAEKCGTLGGLKSLLSTGKLDRAMVHARARHVLT